MFALGVKVESYTKDGAINVAKDFLHSEKQAKIYTINPEMIVRAQKDEYFKQVLNTGDVNTCDGFGLKLFFNLKRVTGVDFMLDICKLAAEQEKSIYLLGSGSEDVVKKTAENLQKQFPNLKIAGYNKGPKIEELRINNYELIIADNETILNKINNFSTDILFVAFGMSKQEKWIHENLAKIPKVKIAMGVGGSFDYISGAVPRAPLFLRRIGLEWMYRLIIQPKRLIRIINATIVFTWLVIKSKYYD
ncbi:MAG: WecB/TagA/CpsF family glycosyltransferase [Candidatus Magasanikbacteria bacterium]